MLPVALSRGFLVLLFLPEDEGAAFPPWKAGAGVVPVGIFGAFCPSHGADTSSCTCGRAGNSREWPENSSHGNYFIAGNKLLEPPTGSQCPEAVEGLKSVAEEPGQPSSRAFPHPFGFGMLRDGFKTHGRCSIPLFWSIPVVQDIPAQMKGLGLTQTFLLQGFYLPFYPQVLWHCRTLSMGIHWGDLGASLGHSGGVWEHWNVGMLSVPEIGTEFSRGNGQELIKGISGDGLGAQIVIRIQMNFSPGAVPGTCPKAPGLG